MKTDPNYYDPLIAGYWVWGLCQWIGAGWCAERNYNGHGHQKLPHLGDAGMGVHRPSQQLRHLGNAGRGVHRPSQQLPHLGNAGRGVHRPSQQLPHLGNAKRGDNNLRQYLQQLADRLARVRVSCGDWKRICGPSVLFPVKVESRRITAVFLDPPYHESVGRDCELYGCDDKEVSAEVRDWAIEHGKHPRLRICLAGYDGEHKMPKRWSAVRWRNASHGYGGQCKIGYKNKDREVLWFSPACLKPTSD